MTDTIKTLQTELAKIESEMQKKKDELFLLEVIKINKAIKALQ